MGSLVRLGAPAGGNPPTGNWMGQTKEGFSWEGPSNIVDHIKYAFIPFQNRADYGMMSWPRIDYGPHRMDYGTVSRPKNTFINIFYGIYEYPFILAEDKWAVFRFIRHIIG